MTMGRGVPGKEYSLDELDNGSHPDVEVVGWLAKHRPGQPLPKKIEVPYAHRSLGRSGRYLVRHDALS